MLVGRCDRELEVLVYSTHVRAELESVRLVGEGDRNGVATNSPRNGLGVVVLVGKNDLEHLFSPSLVVPV